MASLFVFFDLKNGKKLLLIVKGSYFDFEVNEIELFADNR